MARNLHVCIMSKIERDRERFERATTMPKFAAWRGIFRQVSINRNDENLTPNPSPSITDGGAMRLGGLVASARQPTAFRSRPHTVAGQHPRDRRRVRAPATPKR